MDTNDHISRILSLAFDHEVFRVYPGGPLMDVSEIVSNDSMVKAAIERLDCMQRTPNELTTEDEINIAAMVKNCAARLRKKHDASSSQKS